jgi:hypothetical protein
MYKKKKKNIPPFHFRLIKETTICIGISISGSLKTLNVQKKKKLVSILGSSARHVCPRGRCCSQRSPTGRRRTQTERSSGKHSTKKISICLKKKSFSKKSITNNYKQFKLLILARP